LPEEPKATNKPTIKRLPVQVTEVIKHGQEQNKPGTIFVTTKH